MFKIKILLLVFLAFVGVGLLNPILAYAQTTDTVSTSDSILLAQETPPEEPVDPGTGEETEETPETCLSLTFANTITFGWILCPIMSFLANLVQDMFEWVLGKSPIGGEEYCNLVVEFDDTGTRDCGTEFDREQVQDTWNAFRVLANSFFVLAFLYAIYQVAFASGNNAYLIRSMLPRLAASVVLVQLSFFFSEILINMSNEFGAYVDQLFDWVFRDDDEFSLGGIIFGADDSIEDIIFNKIALAATVILLFFSWTTVLAAVGLSMLVVFLVLVARKLLILMAVVLAPIAAIAWIHPQTDGFAKAWWHTFSKLLIMYPLIILLIRSGELMARASSGTGEDAIFDLVRFIAFFAPFFLIPFTFQFAGGLIGQAAGVVNNRSKGLVDRARGVDQQRRERRKQDALADVRNARQNNYKPTAVKRFQAGLLGSSLLYGKKGGQLHEAEKTAEALNTEQRMGRAKLKGWRTELEGRNLDIQLANLEDTQRKIEIEAEMTRYSRSDPKAQTPPLSREELTDIAINKSGDRRDVERIAATLRLTQMRQDGLMGEALASMPAYMAAETVNRDYGTINEFAPHLTSYAEGKAPQASKVVDKGYHQVGSFGPEAVNAVINTKDTSQITTLANRYIEAFDKNQPLNPAVVSHFSRQIERVPGIDNSVKTRLAEIAGTPPSGPTAGGGGGTGGGGTGGGGTGGGGTGGGGTGGGGTPPNPASPVSRVESYNASASPQTSSNRQPSGTFEERKQRVVEVIERDSGRPYEHADKITKTNIEDFENAAKTPELEAAENLKETRKGTFGPELRNQYPEPGETVNPDEDA